MVAASSYQKDGRAAPPRLTTAANTATISGSSAAWWRCDWPASETFTEVPGPSRSR